mmetsp:Transcript_127758/g.342866  ORF Transcript_127758/g.342866 Transcript_127758/m.342866 type:complete len:232 (-) Transcript_127758:193-888(-)
MLLPALSRTPLGPKSPPPQRTTCRGPCWSRGPPLCPPASPTPTRAPATTTPGAWATPRCACGRACTSRRASARTATSAGSATTSTRPGPCTSAGSTGRPWRGRRWPSASPSRCPSSSRSWPRWACRRTPSGRTRASAPRRAEAAPPRRAARSRPGSCGPWRRRSGPCRCGRCWWCCRGRRGRRPHARRPCWTRCSRSCGRWATSSTSGRRSPETIEFGQALFATSSSMLGI